MSQYLEGYKKAIKNVEEQMTETINDNGGAQTTLEVINTFNQFVRWINNELTDIYFNEKEEKERPTEGDSEEDELEVEISSEDADEILDYFLLKLIGELYEGTNVHVLKKKEDEQYE